MTLYAFAQVPAGHIPVLYLIYICCSTARCAGKVDCEILVLLPVADFLKGLYYAPPRAEGELY